MANTTLGKIPASYNFTIYRRKQDAIPIVQSCVHRRIVIPRKPLAEKRLEVNSRCVSLAIGRIPRPHLRNKLCEHAPLVFACSNIKQPALVRDLVFHHALPHALFDRLPPFDLLGDSLARIMRSVKRQVVADRIAFLIGHYKLYLLLSKLCEQIRANINLIRLQHDRRYLGKMDLRRIVFFAHHQIASLVGKLAGARNDDISKGQRASSARTSPSPTDRQCRNRC